MKLVLKIVMVLGVVGFLAVLECVINCSCNLVAYPASLPLKICDNTKPADEVTEETLTEEIKQEEIPIEESQEEETFTPEETENTEQPAKQITLLVYMAADNDLETEAIRNLKEMERADFENMNVLVLFDRSEEYDETNDNWTDTRLFEIKHDSTNSANIVSTRLDCAPLGLSRDSQTELDMGNQYVLKTFIEFAKENYIADYYALIMWGHGSGWRYCNSVAFEQSVESDLSVSDKTRAVAFDDKTNTYMSIKELGAAVQRQQISVIGFDTCFGGTLETIYELRNWTKYTVASAGITPGAGWDYRTLLQSLSTTIILTPFDIAKAMQKSSIVSTTIVDNKKIDSLNSAFEDFSKALAQTITNREAQSSILASLLHCKSYSYNQYPCDLFLDIFSMAELFKDSQTTELSAASNTLEQELSVAAFSSGSENPQIAIHFIPMNSRFITQNHHNSNYLKDDSNLTQCAFIKQNSWWVPTPDGSSGSVLDNLFYVSF